MSDAAVASGLMPHQKDEHDIWICKDCGWKYPNAKPSSKIRKHHKKQCPGKAGASAHAAGGSSDDASDDDHLSHHTGSVTPKETAVDPSVPPMEMKSREVDFGSLEEDLESKTAPAEAIVVNGAAKEAPPQKEATIPAAVPVSAGGLMPHQKDEHDIWICKVCGWKYPNAKPSPKIRKNHKKHCPGKGGSVAAGGSSDEASDDEHHHAPAAPAAAVESGKKESDSTAAVAAETPSSIFREIDFAALKEAPSLELTKETPTADTSPEAGNGTKEFPSPASELAGLAKAVPQEAPIRESGAPAAAAGSGLLVHQKDEDDIWICKDCGWKYPNAKPSPKIRKSHKKKCPGRTPGAVSTTGESSDEASDDEHHLSSLAPAATVETPAAPVEIPPAVETGKEDRAAAPEVPGSISRAIDFAALKESSNPVVENETLAASIDETTPAVSATETRSEDAGAVSLSKETDEKEAPKRIVSLQEAIDKETEQEKESATATGLMPHQKDEHDIWVCKHCGWKYPNANPSPKIRKQHKKKCPANTGAHVDGASGDEASDDGKDSGTGETALDKDVKDSTPAVPEAEVPDTDIKSRGFSLSSAVQASDATPAAEEKATKKEDPAKVAETEQAPPTTIGGLMPHQKDEGDIWVCKECGWRYPNAKPSAKIRKNHKKKCPKNVGAAKRKDGGTSDGSSSEEDSKLKGGKCFPCL